MIYRSDYQLIKKSRFNSSNSDLLQHGTLIKVEDQSGHWGVADLCPWLTLGDTDVQTEIQSQGALFRRAVELAHEDLHARKIKVSLLQDKPIKNNWLITDFSSYKFPQNLSGTVKVKADSRFKELFAFLDQLSRQEVKIRLDFNGSLAILEFDYFLKQLPQGVIKKLEYIEDPTVWNSEDWARWNGQIPLGLDFTKVDPFKHLETWSYLIIKPSRQQAVDLITQCQIASKRFTMTSAMDHAVGFAHGLRYAQTFAENESGFLTLDHFRASDFHSYFEITGTEVNFSHQALNDYGIGMTTLLEKLEWKVL